VELARAATTRFRIRYYSIEPANGARLRLPERAGRSSDAGRDAGSGLADPVTVAA
jgi:hypothetical protein